MEICKGSQSNRRGGRTFIWLKQWSSCSTSLDCFINTQAAAEIASLQVQRLICNLGRDDMRNRRTTGILSQESKHYDALQLANNMEVIISKLLSDCLLIENYGIIYQSDEI